MMHAMKIIIEQSTTSKNIVCFLLSVLRMLNHKKTTVATKSENSNKGWTIHPAARNVRAISERQKVKSVPFPHTTSIAKGCQWMHIANARTGAKRNAQSWSSDGCKRAKAIKVVPQSSAHIAATKKPEISPMIQQEPTMIYFFSTIDAQHPEMVCLLRN